MFESRAAFIDYSTFFGSDYFLNLLNEPYNPDDLLRRVGDAYYDTHAVLQQIHTLTGQRQLAGQPIDYQQQMKNLLENGAAYANSLSLSLGVALTPEQQANLTQDIVWYEEVEHQGEMILAPKLYVASIDLDQLPKGAARITAGGNIDLAANNIIGVDGTFAARDALHLQADDAILLTGGLLNAHDIMLESGGNTTIAMKTERNSNGSNVGGTFFDDLAAIHADNNLIITSGGSTTLAGVEAQIGNNLTIESGDNTSILSGVLESHYETTTPGNFNLTTQQRRNIASQIEVGGDLALNADGSIAVLGSVLSADGSLQLHADEDVHILSTQDSSESFMDSRKKGFMRSSRNTSRHTSLTHNASQLYAGENLEIQSGRDTNIIASHISGLGDVTIDAGTSGEGNLNILAGKDVEGYYHRKSKTGLSLGFDDGMMNYAKIRKDKRAGHHEQLVASTIDAGGDVNLSAADDVTAMGSYVFAGDNLNIDAGNDIHVIAAQTKDSDVTQHMEGKIGVGIIAGDGELGVKAALRYEEDRTRDYETTQHGSLFYANNNVNMQAGRDVNVVASEVTAGNDLQLDAGRDINILSATEDQLHSERHLDAEIGIKASVAAVKARPLATAIVGNMPNAISNK